MRKAETAQINNVVPSGFHAYALLTNGQLHMFFVNSGQFNINVTASDGVSTVSKLFNVTVANVSGLFGANAA